MKLFYTFDADDFEIEENAHIHAIETRSESEGMELLSEIFKKHYHNFLENNQATLSPQPGIFGDCWIRNFENPSGKDWLFKPFTAEEIHIYGPGENPGGHQWWIVPVPTVWVVNFEIKSNGR